MTQEEPKAGAEDRERTSSPAARREGGGFFTIYKPTQGKVTRLATGAGIALLIGMTMWFLYTEVPAYFAEALRPPQANTNYLWWNILVLVVGLALAALGWRLINKPSNAEFLIATDSEMKKVNWTTRKQLWGSTKVVILFMFMIAGILFIVDMVFHYIFYFLNVLKFAPFEM
ncbi:MAG: preprotein translocase subunit SecE [Phycisphaerae bacterium]|nr:preprotein translocase subunit SecE [Phycisphaerae bacterium]MDW8261421.1 preprotein translocase subunit SecE [Phycisphaerales bacterium]